MGIPIPPIFEELLRRVVARLVKRLLFARGQIEFRTSHSERRYRDGPIPVPLLNVSSIHGGEHGAEER